jgi:hypothetical protein
VYLRRKEWCKCERSCNAAIGTFEYAVSVYECEAAGPGKWRGRGGAFDKHARPFKDKPYLLDLRQKWYLVTGEHVGTGADHEPLLKEVTPHKIVVWNGELFSEDGDVKSIEYDPHPRFPNCTCSL